MSSRPRRRRLGLGLLICHNPNPNPNPNPNSHPHPHPHPNQVVRTAFRFVQHARREQMLESPSRFLRWLQAALMPMHRMLPLMCSNEHELIAKTFVQAATTR